LIVLNHLKINLSQAAEIGVTIYKLFANANDSR